MSSRIIFIELDINPTEMYMDCTCTKIRGSNTIVLFLYMNITRRHLTSKRGLHHTSWRRFKQILKKTTPFHSHQVPLTTLPDLTPNLSEATRSVTPSFSLYFPALPFRPSKRQSPGPPHLITRENLPNRWTHIRLLLVSSFAIWRRRLVLTAAHSYPESETTTLTPANRRSFRS